MKLSRRTFLKQCAAVGALALWHKPVFSNSSKISDLRAIPSSGEKIPAIGMGTSRTFDVGPDPMEREDLKEVLRLFVQLGGTVVDSSPMYGNAETVVGDLAQQLAVQKKLFYATKVWTEGKRAGIQQMEQSMKRMRRPLLDLIQIHNLVDWKTHLDTLIGWKKEGRVRYLGITHYRADYFDELEFIMKRHKLDFVQLNYSIVTREAEKRLLPLAKDKGIAILVNRPYERGALFRQVKGKTLPSWAGEINCNSWGQFFLKYILGESAVTCVIPATSKPKHMMDNMGAGTGPLPGKALRKKMIALVE